jgi:hypothetical protein
MADNSGRQGDTTAQQLYQQIEAIKENLETISP